MGAKSDHFCLFSAYFGVFSPDLWMEYRIFISIVDISANLENIDIDIDIDNAILKISISISISIRLFWKISISISIGLFWKISISISILIRRFCKISKSIRRFRKILILIKYRIDKNFAYRTGLAEVGLTATMIAYGWLVGFWAICSWQLARLVWCRV